MDSFLNTAPIRADLFDSAAGTDRSDRTDRFQRDESLTQRAGELPGNQNALSSLEEGALP